MHNYYSFSQFHFELNSRPLLLVSEGLIGNSNRLFYMLTEVIIKGFNMEISLSLRKREIRESSVFYFA
jgi:hypothetical protein